MTLEIIDVEVVKNAGQDAPGYETRQDDKRIISRGSMTVKAGEILTLEGDNKAGKSTLVKAVAGVYRGSAAHWHRNEIKRKASYDMTVSLAVRIDGDSVGIRNVQDAQAKGIVAVFQDDELIPTMTAAEQILLRHGRQPALTVVRPLARFVEGAVSWFPISEYVTADSLIDRFFPSLPGRDRRKEEKLLEQALDLFKAFGPQYLDTLGAYPNSMSGGEKAVTRIVSAMITSNIRYLFLDEIFRGVQKNVWPKIIRKLREISQQKGIGVVAVSHVQDEIYEWRPSQRYVIANRTLRAKSIGNLLLMAKAIPNRVKTTAVLEVTTQEAGSYSGLNVELIQSFNTPIVVFVDAVLKNHNFVNWLIAEFRSKGIETTVLEVPGGEQSKSLDVAIDLAKRVFRDAKLPIGGFVAIGGGATLNVCGFSCSLIARGIYSLVLVPTTIMALADVAIGSKTAINLEPNQSPEPRTGKHSIGTYHNPAAVLVCRDIIDRGSINILTGLAEVLKHALALDVERVKSVLAAIRSALEDQGDFASIYELAIWTMRTKADLLAVDPFEQGKSRILQIGHLHAHSLETASGYAVPHGVAVYWGLLIDLTLSQKLGSGVSDELSKAGGHIVEILASRTLFPLVDKHISTDVIKFYSADTKRYHRSKNGFNVFDFSFESDSPRFLDVTDQHILAAIKEASGRIRAAATSHD